MGEVISNATDKQQEQFETQVFPDEMEVIGKRREAAKLPSASRGDSEEPHGLVGLALSGGGIRSATFNLGVLQVFAKRGLLRWFDYLSTVSGGGYIGSALSTVLQLEERSGKPPGHAFIHTTGEPESDTIKHFRSGGNYLAPGGLLDYFRIPALLLRGIIINLLVLAPFVGGFALWFAWLHPNLITGSWEEVGLYSLARWAIPIFFLSVVAFPPIAKLFRGAKYKLRSAYEQYFGALLFVALYLLFVVSLPALYRYLVLSDKFERMNILGAFMAAAATLIPLVRSLEQSLKKQSAGIARAAGLMNKVVDQLKVLSVAILGPAIMIIMYLLLSDWIYQGLGDETRLGSKGPRAIALSISIVSVYFFNRAFVDVNLTGMHRFYRDRLSKAYLINPTTGRHEDEIKLSDFKSGTTGAPYHLVNTALNVPGQKYKNMQGRNTDFFMFSPHWTGSNLTGYCDTATLQKEDNAVNLGTALAISGAAASPYMGTLTSKWMVFLLTILNIRLDYWLLNPGQLARGGLLRTLGRKTIQVGPLYLLAQLFGWLNASSKYVNLSDGGHIENLGLYELLRRRCRYIVCSDAERDRAMEFGSLGKLIAFARMDRGIDIRMSNLSRINKDAAGNSRAQWAIGTIDYGPKYPAGMIIYIKSSVTGKEPRDIQAYRAKHPDFPHQSTGDQFFDEFQFESYRALGYLIADQLFPAGGSTVPNIGTWFQNLAPPPTASSSGGASGPSDEEPGD